MIKKFSEADKALIRYRNNYNKDFSELDYETKLYVFKYIDLSYWAFRDLPRRDQELFLSVNLSANYSYDNYFRFIGQFNNEEFFAKAKPVLEEMTQEEMDTFSYNSHFDMFTEDVICFFNENPELKEKILHKYYNNGNLNKYAEYYISVDNRGTPTNCKQHTSPCSKLKDMTSIVKMLRFINWNVTDDYLNDLIYTHFVFNEQSYVHQTHELTEIERTRVVNAFYDMKNLRDINVVKYILHWLRHQITEEQEEMLIRKLFYKTAFKCFYGNVDDFLDSLTITHNKNKILLKNWRFTQYLNN